MKKVGIKFAALVVAVALLSPVSTFAQDDKGDKKDKGDKEVKERKEVKQLIVTLKSDNNEKTTIEVNGDKVLVNGKPLEEFKDKNGDVTVRLNKLKDIEFLSRVPGASGTWNYNSNTNHDYKLFTDEANHAMLGVTTEKADEGAKINSITKESAAEKIGLKEGDIITKIGDTKIEDAEDLSAAIKKNKPGDKVEVTYLRDKKEQKATAELTKWKTENFRINMEGMKMDKIVPDFPRTYGQGFSWSGNGPKLGLSVQDTDDGKGVKVIEVDDESNAAKAGIKEEDVVTEVDGKAINTTDEMVKVIRESKDKTSIMVKLQRAGKTQNIEVRMPKKIKTADL